MSPRQNLLLFVFLVFLNSICCLSDRSNFNSLRSKIQAQITEDPSKASIKFATLENELGAYEEKLSDKDEQIGLGSDERKLSSGDSPTPSPTHIDKHAWFARAVAAAQRRREKNALLQQQDHQVRDEATKEQQKVNDGAATILQQPREGTDASSVSDSSIRQPETQVEQQLQNGHGSSTLQTNPTAVDDEDNLRSERDELLVGAASSVDQSGGFSSSEKRSQEEVAEDHFKSQWDEHLKSISEGSLSEKEAQRILRLWTPDDRKMFHRLDEKEKLQKKQQSLPKSPAERKGSRRVRDIQCPTAGGGKCEVLFSD